MKVYVNWEWEKIAKTGVEAIDFMVVNRVCDNFSEYLTNELGFSIEEIFNLGEDEKAKIRKEYAKYLDEVVNDCWEIVEIQQRGRKPSFVHFDEFSALIY